MPDNKPETNFDKEFKEQIQMYQITFNTPEGIKVLADLTSAYYKRGSFDENPYKTAYREGQRSVLIRILNLLEEKNG